MSFKTEQENFWAGSLDLITLTEIVLKRIIIFLNAYVGENPKINMQYKVYKRTWL